MNTNPPVSYIANPAPTAMPIEDEIDLRDLLGIVIDGRWLLTVVAAVVFVLGLGYSAAAKRIYSADALVQVESEKKSIGAALGDMAGMMGGQVEVKAEIEILQSRMVMGRVVDALGLEISAEPHYFPALGYALARRFDGEPGEAASAFLGMGSFAWGGEVLKVSALELPKTLLGKPLRLVAGQNDFELFGPEGGKLLTGRAGERAAADTPYGHVEIFVQDLVARPGTRFDLVRNTRIETIAALQSKLKVDERGKGGFMRESGILSVSLQGDRPDRVTEIVNKIVETYQRQNVERRSAEAAQTLEFLDKHLPELKREMETAETALSHYRLKRGSADLTKETELVLKQSVEFETARVELQQKREEALQRFTPDHPVVLAIDAQLRDVRSEAGRITNMVKGLPETQQELLRLARDVEVNTVLYTTLLNNAQELQVVKAGTVGNVRIIDNAVLPLGPAGPKVQLIRALSLVLGAFLGLVAVFVRRALHAGVVDPAEVERVLGVPAYAAIPFVPGQRRLAQEIKRSPDRERLLAVVDPENVAVEALRSLRTSLHFALLEAPNNIIMLTGPSPGLGKSFVSLNLGAVLAAAGKRVVVIDLDLRRGHLHEYLGGVRTPGFTDYVTGAASREAVIRKTSLEKLVVMPTGTLPPNPAELLMNERVSDFLKTLSAEFDYVIVDTPPVLAVTDAAVVGRLAGTTLLVLKSGAHHMRMIEDALRRLQNAGVNVKGTLFNQMGAAGTRGYSYRYGYSYAYDYKSNTT